MNNAIKKPERRGSFQPPPERKEKIHLRLEKNTCSFVVLGPLLAPPREMEREREERVGCVRFPLCFKSRGKKKAAAFFICWRVFLCFTTSFERKYICKITINHT